MKTEYPRIREEQYRKLIFQTRGQYLAILNVFRCYGLDPYVDQAVEECMKVTEQFGMAVRGAGKPVHLYNELKGRATE